jgi:cellulose synthase/poly-beta-1,6-N-acetylglucosamine synthase-like glycosyltransferase
MTEFPLFQPSNVYGAGSPYPGWDTALSALYYVYLVLIGLLILFSGHAYLMVLLRRRCHKAKAMPLAAGDDLPRVSLQIPIYNERLLAVQALEAAARIDYPAERLQILLLDGSTDETPSLLAPVVDRLRRQGRNVVHHRRDNARGYKAGAMAEGVGLSEGELIAVFDADFLPGRRFLRRVVPHFVDPRIGCVQTRWGHRNADASLLTRDQSIMLDAYYGTELPARSDCGLVALFTGTCGVWRKECIQAAGGWQADTLVEDMDLSLRAQLCGWRLVYDGTVFTRGELPQSLAGFIRQQRRWVMGHAQICRKHLAGVLLSDWPVRRRLEALVLLFRWAAYPLILAMALLLMPALIVRPELRQMSVLESLGGLVLFLLATSGASIYYMSGQWALHPRTWLRRVLYLPTLVSMTLVLAPNCAWAGLRGVLGRKEPFHKTPRVSEGRPRLQLAEIVLTVVNGLVGLYLLASAGYTFYRAFSIEKWDFLITGVALLVFAAGLTVAALQGLGHIFGAGLRRE